VFSYRTGEADIAAIFDVQLEATQWCRDPARAGGGNNGHEGVLNARELGRFKVAANAGPDSSFGLTLLERA